MPHLNGLFGIREMRRFGMIIDCSRQMLYMNPNGPSSAVSQSLANFLVTRGFSRIPMRLNANDHFDVEGALNSHETKFIVDTGSANTLVDTQVAVKSGTGVTALAPSIDRDGWSGEPNRASWGGVGGIGRGGGYRYCPVGSR